MASNLSSIGFRFANDEEFADTMGALAGEAQDRISCEPGDYVVWRSSSGSEIWFHLPLFGNEDVAADLVGLSPFFAGDSDVTLKITARASRPDDNEFEGSFTAWVAPDEDSGEGSYPLVLDAVDFAAHLARELPLVCHAKITAFAREVRVFPDDAAYLARQESNEQQAPLAPKSFIPVGLFAQSARSTSDNDGDDSPQEPASPAALFTGRVLKHLELTNGRQQTPFHWLVVESLDATYDVVADPEVISGSMLREGATVEVSGMLFGRLLD